MSDPISITIADLAAVSTILVQNPSMYYATERVKLAKEKHTNITLNIASTENQIAWLQNRLAEQKTDQKTAEGDVSAARSNLADVTGKGIADAVEQLAAATGTAGIAVTKLDTEDKVTKKAFRPDNVDHVIDMPSLEQIDSMA